MPYGADFRRIIGVMALPVMPIKLPEVLIGQENGRLPLAILVSTPGQAGGPTVRLVSPAARAWRALCSAALKSGHTLKATSSADSYRTYQQQVDTFTSRFQLDPIIGQPTRRWQGQTWWLIPGNAIAAVPGTSNHGYGLAVDTGEERDGDTGTESIDAATLAWLVANEAKFGFSHEVQSEPWHIRYCMGDDIPPAVLAFEEEDMEQTEPLIVATGVPGRRVGDTFADLQKLRTVLMRVAGVEGNPQPEPGSLLARLDAFLKDPPSVPVNLTEADRDAIVSDILAAVVPVIVTEVAKAGAEARDAVADLGEGGSTQVRDDE